MEYVDQEAEQIIEQHMKRVPPLIREYIQSEAFPRVIRTLISKHNLHVDTAYDVEVKTILLLLGLQQPSEYVQSLKEIGLDDQTANAIAADMNREVFKPLMQSYKPQQNAGESTEADTPTPQPPKAPQPAAEPKQFTNVFADEPAEQKTPNVPQGSQVHKRDLAPELPENLPGQEPETSQQEEKKIEKRYAADPYREPLD